MYENTKSEYRSIAHYFYKKRNIANPTGKKVSDALKHYAAEYRPDYWRRLRTALALVAYEQGFYKAADRISATINPVTSDPARRDEIKAKQLRQRSVNAADEKQLLDYLYEKQETIVFTAVTLVSHLGCRPAELEKLVFLDQNKILIPSAKQREDNDRGLDRIIQINDPQIYNALKTSHEMFLDAPYKDPIRYVQRRLDTLTKRLWPTRKVRPSLYSWRHQLGSDLKASEMDSAEIAAIMGHRSIDSVNVYGNRRSARNARSYLTPTREIVKHVERINRHRLLNQKNTGTTFAGLAEKIQKQFGSGGYHKTNKP